MRRGQMFPTYLNYLTRICLFTIQLLWRYDFDFTYSGLHPCIVFFLSFVSLLHYLAIQPSWNKDHTALCACAKSRHPGTLP